MKARNERPCVF